MQIIFLFSNTDTFLFLFFKKNNNILKLQLNKEIINQTSFQK